MSPDLVSALYVVKETAVWSPVIPAIVGALRFKNCVIGLRVIVLLASLALITNLILNYFGDDDNFTVYIPRIYTVIEFSLITFYFSATISRPQVKKWMMIMFLPFAVVVALDFLVEGLSKRDELAMGVEAFIFVLYALMSFYFTLKEAEYSNIMTSPHFWIISSVLLYFGGSIFIFITNNYVETLSMDAAVFLWGVHALICIIFYSLMTIGLWKIKASR